MMRVLTKEIVHELLEYNPIDGTFKWKIRDRKWFRTERGMKIFNSSYAGHIAGEAHEGGIVHRRINLLGKEEKTHRIVWLYFNGSMPKELDHINGNRQDNRIENLREVTRSGNSKNHGITKRNTSGFVGVHYSPKRRDYQAYIVSGGKRFFLGYYKKLSDAVKARVEAEALHGFHIDHGMRPAVRNG